MTVNIFVQCCDTVGWTTGSASAELVAVSLITVRLDVAFSHSSASCLNSNQSTPVKHKWMKAMNC